MNVNKFNLFLLAIFTLFTGCNRKHPSKNISLIDTLYAKEHDLSSSRRTAIVEATEKVSKAVVSITSQSTQIVAESPFFNDPFFDFWRGFFPPSYRKEQIKSLGSGVIVSPDGYIITNQHVVNGGDKITVTLEDGRTFKAKIVGQDERLDLALLKIDAQDLPFARFFNSDSLYIGEWAIAIGNPFGFLLEDLSPTVTQGVVSALHRTIRGKNSEHEYRDMIQTDASINPGNSGGPLVNALGLVIGINTFIISKSGGNEGIGFAIPSNTVVKVIKELKEYHKVRRAFWGFSAQNLTPSLKKALSYKKVGGILVNNVFFNDTKLKEGDVITHINGRRIFNTGDLEDITYALLPKEVLKIRYIRAGHIGTATIRARELRYNEVNIEKLRIKCTRLTQELAAFLKIPYSNGILITEVDPSGYGMQFGLQKNDIIFQINNKKIQNPDDLNRELKKPGRKILFVDRGGEKFTLSFVVY